MLRKYKMILLLFTVTSHMWNHGISEREEMVEAPSTSQRAEGWSCNAVTVLH